MLHSGHFCQSLRVIIIQIQLKPLHLNHILTFNFFYVMSLNYKKIKEILFVFKNDCKNERLWRKSSLNKTQ